MTWPSVSHYNDAVQNPRISFADPELRAGAPELNALGLPRPVTGSFASVYALRCGNRRWAVRCFTRDFPDYQRRYNAIGAYLTKRKLPYTVGFEFQQKGVLVSGAWYPVVKMEWVDGRQLNEHVRSVLGDAAALSALADKWLALVRSLRKAGIAHGDLQHGNVMVIGTSLKLVDYDGMFVPALKGSGSHESGHPAYQHPARTGIDFDDRVDRFSSLAIYLALRALQRRPELWQQFDNQDNLLFRRADYRDPEPSPLFQTLLTDGDPQIRQLAQALRDACQSPLGRVPWLDELVGRPGASPVVRPSANAPSRRPSWMDDHLPPPARARAKRDGVRRKAPVAKKPRPDGAGIDGWLGRELHHVLYGHGVVLGSATNIGGAIILHVQFDNGAEKSLVAGHPDLTLLPLTKRKVSPRGNLDRLGTTGFARLHRAARSGSVGEVERLLRLGADPNVVGEFGRTPLHIAAMLGYTEVVKALVKGRADVNRTDRNGSTPLHLAARNDRAEVVRLLFERGANPILMDNQGWIPFHAALSAAFGRRTFPPTPHASATTAHAKLAAPGTDRALPLPARRGFATRFRAAVRAGKTDIVDASLEADPSMVHHRDRAGRTPLHDAVERLQPAVVEILLRYNPDLSLADGQGDTPLTLARRVAGQEGDPIRRMLDRGGASATNKTHRHWWDSFGKRSP
jgi:ankyrin repeat protein